MTNYSNNCVRYLLIIFATFFVYGNAGATPITFGNGNSTYEQNADGSFTVTLKAAGDLKAMENTWNYGSNTPWKSASKLILYLDESIGSSAIQEIKNTDELYLLTQNTTVSTLDLSNLSNDQADYLKPDVKWPDQWSTQSQSLRNIIVPDKYATTPNSYASNQINSIGKTGSTIYLYRQYNNYDIEWSLIRNDETTLKIVGEYSNGFNISNATYFENIDLTNLSFSDANAKITLPTVGADGVALKKIIVISNDAKSMIANTDAATLAAIKVASSGSGDSGEGGEGGEGGGGTETPTYTDVSGTIKLKLTEKIANREQLTDVPTIYLDIPDVTTINNDLAKVTDPETGDTKYFKASIQVIDNSEAGTPQHLTSFTETELEIKVRGNSTSTAAKRPYRLKFAKKHKHDLLGYGYEKRNWTLLANAFDGSMMRNAITYHLGKYVGLDKGAGFCPGYKFVDLVINGDYRGTYQVSDHIQVDGDRININEDTDWFLEGVAWSNQAEEPYVGQEPSICIKNPAPETEEEITALKSEVNAWRTQWLAAFDSMDPNTGWQAMNDVESFIKYYIAVNLTGDIDSWFVFKGYRTPTGPFFWGPLWDKDLAFGNWSQADPQKLVEFYDKCNFEWKIQALLSQRAFVEKALECINTLINEGLESKLDADIDRIAGILEKTQKLNYQLYDITAMGSGYIQKSTYEEYVAQRGEEEADVSSWIKEWGLMFHNAVCCKLLDG